MAVACTVRPVAWRWELRGGAAVATSDAARPIAGAELVTAAALRPIPTDRLPRDPSEQETVPW